MARPRKIDIVLDKMIRFRIDERHNAMLEKMCKRDNKSKSAIIRRAIRNEFYELGYNEADL